MLWIGIVLILIWIRISNFGADTDPEWHQNDADPHVGTLHQIFTHWKLWRKKNYLYFTAVPAYNVFLFSSVARSCDYKYFGQHIEIFHNKKVMCLLPFISSGYLLTAAFKFLSSLWFWDMEPSIQIWESESYLIFPWNASALLSILLFTCLFIFSFSLLMRKAPLFQAGSQEGLQDQEAVQPDQGGWRLPVRHQEAPAPQGGKFFLTSMEIFIRRTAGYRFVSNTYQKIEIWNLLVQWID